MKSDPVVLGISFGNSNSCVAFIQKDGKPACLPNPDGDRSIPCVLSFIDNDEHHGMLAKEQAITNSCNTIKKFRDEFLQNTEQRLLQSDLTPFDVLCKQFQRLKESAEMFLGSKIDHTVLAVACDFQNTQVEIVTKAAIKAGLISIYTIKEPVAQLLAIDSFMPLNQPDSLILVLDLGGLRSDLTIVARRKGLLTILDSTFSTSLGGDRVDNILAQHIAAEFKKKHGIDPLQKERSRLKLLFNVEIAKKYLYNKNSTTVYIESLADGINLSFPLTRVKYKLLLRDFFAQLQEFIKALLAKTNLNALIIDELVLTGGSSKIPDLVSRLLAITPNARVLSQELPFLFENPNELTALGSAIHASLTVGFDKEEIMENTSSQVCSVKQLSEDLGYVIEGFDFAPVLRKYTAIPCKSRIVLKAINDKKQLLITICEATSEIVTRIADEESDDEQIVNYKVTKTVANLQVLNVDMELILHIDQDFKLEIVARPLVDSPNDIVRLVI